MAAGHFQKLEVEEYVAERKGADGVRRQVHLARLKHVCHVEGEGSRLGVLLTEGDGVDGFCAREAANVRELVVVHVQDAQVREWCHVERGKLVLRKLDGADGFEFGFDRELEGGELVLVEVEVDEGGEAFDACDGCDLVAAQVEFCKPFSSAVRMFLGSESRVWHTSLSC